MRKKYLNISELSILLGLVNKLGKPANYIIRFWEKEFKHIKPTKLENGRRYYDDDQVKNIRFIKYLLKDKGLTINGVKKFLINEGSFNLDENLNNTINTKKVNLKSKLKKISRLVKEIKKIG